MVLQVTTKFRMILSSLQTVLKNSASRHKHSNEATCFLRSRVRSPFFPLLPKGGTRVYPRLICHLLNLYQTHSNSQGIQPEPGFHRRSHQQATCLLSRRRSDRCPRWMSWRRSIAFHSAIQPKN
jgi:hypothetical protein